MKNILLLLLMSLPILCFSGKYKEFDGNYVLEFKTEFVESGLTEDDPFVHIIWEVRHNCQTIRTGSVIIPIWYDLDSLMTEVIGDYFLQPYYDECCHFNDVSIPHIASGN